MAIRCALTLAKPEATRALVIHEPDVAASTSGPVTFREGTVLHDRSLVSTSDAADTFAALPSEAAR